MSPGRLWSTLAALDWATRLRLFPTVDLRLSKAITRGVEAASPPRNKQLWFHPLDLPILSRVDADFEAAGLLSFDLMLRAGQLERLRVRDLDHSRRGVWCPPHKNVINPYLRNPKPSTWEKIATKVIQTR